MSIPNSLTVIRIVLTPVFLVLLFSESSFLKQISLVVYIVAALTDYYDGWVARKFGYVSRWGKFLDPLADKILAAAALFAFVHLNLVDGWMVWTIVLRDFIITGLRSYAEWKNQPIVTSKTAQAKTFGQFVIIYYILILYVAGNVPVIHNNWGSYIDSLMHPQVLFGMMMLAVLSNVGTAIMYLFGNRKFLRELYVDTPQQIDLRSRRESSTQREETPDSQQQNIKSAERGSIPFLVRFVATGFFSGYSPITPGTAGSFVGLLLYAIPGMENPVTLSILIVVVLFVGIATAAKMEQHLGEDPQVVVIDEIVGMWISLLLLPKSITIALIGFFFFRVYDTIKPQPARYAEHFKHGWGVMLDDVVAGIYANVSVRLVLLLFFKG